MYLFLHLTGNTAPRSVEPEQWSYFQYTIRQEFFPRFGLCLMKDLSDVMKRYINDIDFMGITAGETNG